VPGVGNQAMTRGGPPGPILTQDSVSGPRASARPRCKPCRKLDYSSSVSAGGRPLGQRAKLWMRS